MQLVHEQGTHRAICTSAFDTEHPQRSMSTEFQQTRGGWELEEIQREYIQPVMPMSISVSEC